MSLEEKIKNAKTVTWLADGFTDEELEKIREKAQKRIEKAKEHFSDTSVDEKVSQVREVATLQHRVS